MSVKCETSMVFISSGCGNQPIGFRLQIGVDHLILEARPQKRKVVFGRPQGPRPVVGVNVRPHSQVEPAGWRSGASAVPAAAVHPGIEDDRCRPESLASSAMGPRRRRSRSRPIGCCAAGPALILSAVLTTQSSSPESHSSSTSMCKLPSALAAGSSPTSRTVRFCSRITSWLLMGIGTNSHFMRLPGKTGYAHNIQCFAWPVKGKVGKAGAAGTLLTIGHWARFRYSWG